MKKVSLFFLMNILLFLFSADALWAMDPVLCQSEDPQKAAFYVAVMNVPTQPGDVPQAKLFYGSKQPYKPEPIAQCENPVNANNAAKGILMHCWVMYGPDGGQGLVLRKNTVANGARYVLTLTAMGPTGAGASDELMCR